MRRLLNSLVEYPASLWNAVLRGWNAFFFTPADPTTLGLIRVGVGALLFWSLLVYGLDLHAYFGSAGWADPDAELAMAYVMNRMDLGLSGDSRTGRLFDATYASL